MFSFRDNLLLSFLHFWSPGLQEIAGDNLGFFSETRNSETLRLLSYVRAKLVEQRGDSGLPFPKDTELHGGYTIDETFRETRSTEFMPGRSALFKAHVQGTSDPWDLAVVVMEKLTRDRDGLSSILTKKSSYNKC